MPKRLINLQFPLGGLDRRYSYRGQPPFTTPDALNVRPKATQDRRTKGGSRPGTGKAYYTQLGSGNPIRMLADVTIVGTDGFTFWEDNFHGGSSLGTAWATASHLSAQPRILD